MGRAERAARELRNALEARPGDAGAITLLAAALRRQGKLADAVALLDEHRAQLRDPATWTLLGQLHLELDQHRAAQEAFSRALERGEVPAALEGGAAAAAALGDLERASELLQQVRAIPGAASARSVTLEGRVALGRGDVETAAARYNEALAIDPQWLEALLGAGSLELLDADGDGDPARALRLFERALSISPGHREALLGAGRARLRMGEHSAALRSLEHARALEPTADVLQALAELAEASKAPLDAIVLRREIASLEPADDANTDAIARLEASLRPALEPPTPFDASLSPAVLAEYLARLRNHMAASPLTAPHAGQVSSALEALDAPLDIAVLGEFNAGKSTLVNAYLGEPVVATGVLPTTAHINVIRYGPRRVVRLVLEPPEDAGGGGMPEVLEMGYGQLAEAVAEHSARILRIEYLYPHHELRAVHFIDTPGFNAAVPEHEQIAATVLHDADAIFWLIDANQALSESQRAVLDRVDGSEEKVIVLLNKVDGLDDDERAELMGYLEKNYGAEVHGVFAISALRAFEARDRARTSETEPEAEVLERAGWPAFEEVLHRDLVDRSARLKSLEAVRRTREIVARVLDDAEQNRKRLELMAQQMSEGREALERARARMLRADVVELVDRFETQREMALRTVAREVDDARRPSGGWLSPLQLATEDVGYLLDVLGRRIGEALAQTERQLLDLVTEPIDAAMQTLEWVARALVSTQAEVFTRRLESFVVEERMSRQLLTAQVMGRHRAELAGRTGALRHNQDLAERLGDEDRDEAARRAMLSQIIGVSSVRLAADLSAWVEEYFDSALRLCDNVRRDIERLTLDVEISIQEPLRAIPGVQRGRA